jgi:hypothetical protein
MTVMLGSIQSRRTAINISAFLYATRNINVFSGLTLNTTVHPLPLHFVFPFLPAPIYLIVVDFNGFINTAGFFYSGPAHTGVLIIRFLDQERKKLQRPNILNFIYPIYGNNWRNIGIIYVKQESNRTYYLHHQTKHIGK